MSTQSLAEHLAELAADVPSGPAMVADFLADLTGLEAAALAYDWSTVWRKPKQAPPPGDWRSWGWLGARGLGKSRSNAEFVHEEAASGRAMRIALIGQNEDRCKEVMVHGESGLLAVSPPWFKARFEAGRVIWPNGAQAFVYTPEAPGDIFGAEHHLGWASELHVWRRTTREEAFFNLVMGLRLGYGRLVWDSNPSKRHPILRELLADAEADPVHNIVVRGSTRENRLHLTRGRVEEWERKYGGTQRGREMLEGEQTDEAEGALWTQASIDDHRKPAPPAYRRRVIVVDPAISTRAGTDPTGITDQGLGADGQVYVIADLSGPHEWDAWGEILVKRYFAGRCDCIVLERNRGGDACAGNVRAAAAKISRESETIRVEIVKLDARTRHVPGVIFVKEVIGRGSKGTRAEPVAGLYKDGQVSHVEGADLSNLEDLLTTWIPDGPGESPNALDCVVYGVIELAGLSRETRPDGAAAVRAAAALQARVTPATRPANVATMLGRGGGGRNGDSL